MSKRAELAALEAYPVHLMTISPQEGKHGEILNFGEWLDDFRIGIQSLSANAGFRQGYEQAEKDTAEKAIAWLKEYADKYIVNLTPSYPDAPVTFVVGGLCWEHLRKHLENE